MAKTKVDNKLNVVIGKKSQITGDTAIPENAILIVTDENEQALNVEYNNTTSGLEADNVQDAIDETIELLNNVDLSDYYSKDETFSQTQVNQLLDAKADKLTTAQQNAIDSGITSAKVSQYDGYETSKQDKLTTAQLNAVNSGITSEKVATYDAMSSGGGSIDEVDGATTPIMLKTGSQETLDEDDTLKERELVYSSDKNIFGIYYDNQIRWQGIPLVVEPIIRVRSFGASDSKLSYVGMSPTLKLFQDGNINYYTNDVFDIMYPFRDMKEVEDELGNKFIEIPPFYVKYIVDENDIITGYDIANYKVDEDYGISQAFIDVISGEVKPLWFGKYMAKVDENDKMTSKSGVMANASQTLDWFRQRARNNGLGYYQNSLYTWQIVQMLMWTYFGSINSDDFFPDIGYGSYLNNGSMDNVPYKVAYNSTTGKNTFFGIENILKEKFHFIDGVLLNIPNMYVAKDFRKFATDTTTNYDLVSSGLPSSNNFIVSMAFENGVIYPKVVSGGSSSTYFADYFEKLTENRILYRGSYRASYADSGLSYWCGIYASSYSYKVIGSRLMYSPLTPTE